MEIANSPFMIFKPLLEEGTIMNIMPVNSIQTNNYSNKSNKPSFGMNLSKETLDLMDHRPDLFPKEILEKLVVLQRKNENTILEISHPEGYGANDIRIIVNHKDGIIVYANNEMQGMDNNFRKTIKYFNKALTYLSGSKFKKKTEKYVQEENRKIELARQINQSKTNLIAQIKERANVTQLKDENNQAILDSVVQHFQSPEMTWDQAREIAVGFINAGFKDKAQLIEFAKTVNPSHGEDKLKKEIEIAAATAQK